MSHFITDTLSPFEYELLASSLYKYTWMFSDDRYVEKKASERKIESGDFLAIHHDLGVKFSKMRAAQRMCDKIISELKEIRSMLPVVNQDAFVETLFYLYTSGDSPSTLVLKEGNGSLINKETLFNTLSAQVKRYITDAEVIVNDNHMLIMSYSGVLFYHTFTESVHSYDAREHKIFSAASDLELFYHQTLRRLIPNSRVHGNLLTSGDPT